MFSKRATIAVIVLAMVAVFSSGMMYAFFSDTEQSNGNSFTAGTLDLKVDGVDNPTSTFVVSDAAPGSTDSVSVTLTNTGSITGTLTVAITSVVNEGGDYPEPEQVAQATNAGDLGSKMILTIWVDTDGEGDKDAGETVVYSNNLVGAAGPYDVATLAENENVKIGISYVVLDSAGNEIQGDICSFSIEYDLNQV